MDYDLSLIKELEPEVVADSGAEARQRTALLSVISSKSQAFEPAVPTRSPRRWRSRLIVGLAATGLVGGGAAFALSGLAPDSDQAERILERNRAASRVHTPGWRPTLSAERVRCDYAAAPAGHVVGDFLSVADGSASGFPLGNLLSESDLVAECAAGTDNVRTHPINDTTHVLCVKAADPLPAEVRNRAGARTIGTGKIIQEPMPVIAFGRATCVQAGYAAAPTDIIEQINRRRQEEVAIIAVPEECATFEDARSWAVAQVRALDLTFTLSARHSSGDACYEPMVNWGEATVQVVPRQTPAAAENRP